MLFKCVFFFALAIQIHIRLACGRSTLSHVHCLGPSLRDGVGSIVDEQNARAWSHSCRLHNVCYYGDRFFYVAKDSAISLPGPLLGLSGRREASTLLNVEVIDNVTRRDFAAVLMPGTYLLHQMHGANNPGHVLLESLVPLMALLETFEDDIVEPVYVLMQNRCNDSGLDELRQGDGGKDQCAINIQRYIGAVSKRQIVFLGDLAQQHENKAVCFETVIAGTASYGLHQNPALARGHHFTLARNALYNKYGVQMTVLSDGDDLAPITVVLHEKFGRRNIANYDDVASWITEYSGDLCNKCFNLSRIKLDGITLNDQLHLFSKTNVYISPGGSAAFNALLLGPGSVLVTFPLCHFEGSARQPVCQTFERDILVHIPFVKMLLYPVKDALRRVIDGKGGGGDIVIDKFAFNLLLQEAVAHIFAERQRRNHVVRQTG